MAMVGRPGTVVGALACQKDSYLRSLKTIVLSCTPIAVEAKSKGKSKGKGKGKEKEKDTAEGDVTGPLYEVELQDTVLFPEGGGQPADHGLIYTDKEEDNDKDKAIRVLDVQRKQLRAIHITDKPLEKDSAVRVELEWRRRLDHMQQHTGQHLLSAVLDKYNLPTLSWNMGEKVNYIEVERKLTKEEIEKFNEEVNDEILKNSSVEVKVGADAETETQTETEVGVNAKSESNLDAEKGVMRVVHIGDLDINPCCGTHLSSVGQIKAISLLGQVSAKGGHSRLSFVAGDRVYKYTAELYDTVKQLMNTLSSSEEALVEKGEQMAFQLKKAYQHEKSLSKEIAGLLAEKIVANVLKEHDNGKEDRIQFLYREDGDLAFLNEVFNGVKNGLETTATPFALVLMSGDGAVLAVHTSTPDSPLCEQLTRAIEGLTGLAELVGLRGGGNVSKGRWQGKLPLAGAGTGTNDAAVAAQMGRSASAVAVYLQQL